jgi:hypothetical protein
MKRIGAAILFFVLSRMFLDTSIKVMVRKLEAKQKINEILFSAKVHGRNTNTFRPQ